MSTYYVNSGAGGANDGTSWTDAYTSLATAITGKADGDVFLVHKTHSETLSGNLTLNLSTSDAARGVKIISVDKDASDIYSPGATLTTGANDFQVSAIFRGFTLTTGSQLDLGSASFLEFHDCTLTKTASQNYRVVGTLGRLLIDQCTLALGTSYTAGFSLTASANVIVRKPTFTGTKGTNASLLTMGVQVLGTFLIQDADLSGFDNLLNHGSAGNNYAGVRGTFDGCILPSSFEYDDGATYMRRQTSWASFRNCKSGTRSIPAYEYELQMHEGYARKQATKYRNGGSSDGTTPHAWEIVAAAGRTWKRSA